MWRFESFKHAVGSTRGYTKYPCVLCLWDSRANNEHWIREQWPKRNEFTVGEMNIRNESLVPPDKVILPPLHIKLGLMKQYVKSLDKGGECFKYIFQKFSFLSYEKIKAGVFDRPKMRQLLKDKEFIETMSPEEKNGWIAFSQIVNNFLGNTKSLKCKKIVQNLLDNFHKLVCNMSVKIHFLHSHLEYFPEDLGALSEEQGERFYLDIKIIEKRYQGQWKINMIANYCWCLKRDGKNFEPSRKSKKRKLVP